jgi:hypothetical protein
VLSFYQDVFVLPTLLSSSTKQYIVIAVLGAWCCCTSLVCVANAADVWSIESGELDPNHYFGESVANGMIGLLSAPAPFRTGEPYINGAYEQPRPEAPSCIARTFNMLNVALSIDGHRIERPEQISQFRQRLDFKRAVLTSSFDVGIRRR